MASEEKDEMSTLVDLQGWVWDLGFRAVQKPESSCQDMHAWLRKPFPRNRNFILITAT